MYYEKFPDQLYSFYHGVSGYLYSIVSDGTFNESSEKGMWLSKSDVSIQRTEFIEDVYGEIFRCEQAGLARIIRFEALTEEEQNQCADMMVGYIRKKNLAQSPDSEEARFISRYFVQAWKKTMEPNCEST